MQLEARDGSGGAPFRITATNGKRIKQAWHRDGNEVDYWVHGTTRSGTVNPIEDLANTGMDGMFPADKPSHLQTHTPSPDLLDLTNYSAAVKPWNDVLTSVMTIQQAGRNMVYDVIIKGFWDTAPSGGPGERCGASVACTYASGEYPHIGSRQAFWIEDPPHWGYSPDAERWTTSLSIANRFMNRFEYLPWVLMHEFGHTIGVSDVAKSGTIMGGAARELPPCSTPAAVPPPSPAPTPFPCGLSDYDKNGARAIYKQDTIYPPVSYP